MFHLCAILEYQVCQFHSLSWTRNCIVALTDISNFLLVHRIQNYPRTGYDSRSEALIPGTSCSWWSNVFNLLFSMYSSTGCNSVWFLKLQVSGIDISDLPGAGSHMVFFSNTNKMHYSLYICQSSFWMRVIKSCMLMHTGAAGGIAGGFAALLKAHMRKVWLIDFIIPFFENT